MDSELDSRYRHLVRKWLRPALGTIVCALAAGIFTWAFAGSSVPRFLPLAFLLIIIFTAMWFGNLAGLFGTIVAAMIFAAFLFHPTSSLKVKDSAQRSSLIWMIVGGIAMSELLGSSPQQRPHV